mmetsp:Transcript_11832/g.17944  ORF Transcript_11832/g.17944 Transcript_11832/m.17944 type:complete len:200 (-) Transcript_11832:403-1002(-)
MSCMDEVIYPLAASRMCLGLCHFIVVMGELQINSTGMNIHATQISIHSCILGRFSARHLGKYITGHDTTFNVPPGSTWSPGTVPLGLAFLGLLPQGKIPRAALITDEILGQLSLSLRQQFSIVHLFRCQFTITHSVTFSKRFDVKINATIGFIRQPLLDDGIDVLHDLIHIFRHTREDIGWIDPQHLHIFVKFKLEFSR